MRLRPSWFGYRMVARETLDEYFARHRGAARAGRREVVHPEAVAVNPLPCNVPRRELLPADRGWWGFSFADVPSRVGAETVIATIPDCRVAGYHDAERGSDYYPAVVNGDGRALDLRELRFRPRHAEVLRRVRRPRRLPRATWIVERVYHNHSHWLTAHLPKLLLLRERGALADVLLPRQRTAAIDGSLALFGFDAAAFPTFDTDQPLAVDELTLLATDRFRPELLRLVQRASGALEAPRPWRRVFISRAGASRRRLLNEDEVWRLLARAGFERVRMEDLSFAAQVALMRETAVLCAPHGAGLTNMLFCPPGAHVIEVADLGFPNPNFYALASAVGHRYWLVSAESSGDVHPLEKDLRVEPEALTRVLPGVAAA